jgi:CspA family cold shock protein
MQGTVKYFVGTKGFGFITPDDGREDIFVHHTSLIMDSYKTLKDDQRVEFDIENGPKGPEAINVRPL